MSSVDKAELLQRLRQILPPEALLCAAEDLRPCECDGLSAYRRLPMLVALPETIEREQVFHPLAEPMMQIHRRLKQAFDPERILNPDRLYKDL